MIRLNRMKNLFQRYVITNRHFRKKYKKLFLKKKEEENVRIVEIIKNIWFFYYFFRFPFWHMKMWTNEIWKKMTWKHLFCHIAISRLVSLLVWFFYIIYSFFRSFSSMTRQIIRFNHLLFEISVQRENKGWKKKTFFPRLLRRNGRFNRKSWMKNKRKKKYNYCLCEKKAEYKRLHMHKISCDECSSAKRFNSIHILSIQIKNLKK